MIKIKKLPSNVPGLAYIPWFDEPYDYMNYRDGDGNYDNQVQLEQPNIPLYHHTLSFTPENASILKDCVLNLGNGCKVVMEIGMARDHPVYNSSKTILDNKPAGCKYVGIDVRDMSQYHDPQNNRWFIQSDSKDQDRVRLELSKIGISALDLLFIDGLHSMDFFLNDWKYADLVRSGGYVVFHDTSHHPGPREFFEAIDPNQFNKFKHCLYDYGIGVAQKL